MGGFCKEIIVTAPIVSWALQRWYFSQSWLDSWKTGKRELFFKFLALAPVVVLALMQGGRSGTAASGDSEAVTATEYLLAQGYLIPRYVLSILNPYWVCTDYGLYPPSTMAISCIGLISLTGIFIWSVGKVVSGKAIGLPIFCAAVFLAPSSSIIPIVTQIGGEHRVYLPSLAFFVLSCIGILRFFASTGKDVQAVPRPATWSLVFLFCLSVASITFMTNQSYSTLSAFWKRIVVRVPSNLRARQNLTVVSLRRDEGEEAFRWLENLMSDSRQGTAARLEGAELAEQAKQVARAREYLQPIFNAQPNHVKASIIEARLLVLEEDPSTAVRLCERVLQESPRSAGAWNALALALRMLSRSNMNSEKSIEAKAIEQRTEEALQQALDILPWSANDRFMLAGLYLDQARDAEAERELRECLLYDPMRPEVWYWLAFLDMQKGNIELARSEVAMSLSLRRTPDAEDLARRILP